MSDGNGAKTNSMKGSPNPGLWFYRNTSRLLWYRQQIRDMGAWITIHIMHNLCCKDSPAVRGLGAVIMWLGHMAPWLEPAPLDWSALDARAEEGAVWSMGRSDPVVSNVRGYVGWCVCACIGVCVGGGYCWVYIALTWKTQRMRTRALLFRVHEQQHIRKMLNENDGTSLKKQKHKC